MSNPHLGGCIGVEEKTLIRMRDAAGGVQVVQYKIDSVLIAKGLRLA